MERFVNSAGIPRADDAVKKCRNFAARRYENLSDAIGRVFFKEGAALPDKNRMLAESRKRIWPPEETLALVGLWALTFGAMFAGRVAQVLIVVHLVPYRVYMPDAIGQIVQIATHGLLLGETLFFMGLAFVWDGIKDLPRWLALTASAETIGGGVAFLLMFALLYAVFCGSFRLSLPKAAFFTELMLKQALILSGYVLLLGYVQNLRLQMKLRTIV